MWSNFIIPHKGDFAGELFSNISILYCPHLIFLSPEVSSNKGWVKAKVNFWPRDRPLAHAELVFCLAH